MRGLSLAITLCTLPLLTAQAGDSPSDGQKLYQSFKCAVCHGSDGKTGVKDQVPPLAGLPADRIYTKTLEMGIVKTHESALEDCGTPPSSSEVRKIADYLASVPR
jgi:cytochrome c553